MQNLVSLNLSAQDLADADAAIATLRRVFAPMVALQPSQRRDLYKMGDKSEHFCRQTLSVLASNPQIIPPSLDLAEAQADLAALDLLRPRLVATVGPGGEALEAVVSLLERKAAALSRIRRHLRLKALLEVWLYVHVPLTFALLAELAAHIVSVFFYW